MIIFALLKSFFAFVNVFLPLIITYLAFGRIDCEKNFFKIFFRRFNGFFCRVSKSLAQRSFLFSSLFKFSGWKVEKDLIYYQYPQKHPLWLTKYIWKKLDFEGFFGVILSKDDTYLKMYNEH